MDTNKCERKFTWAVLGSPLTLLPISLGITLLGVAAVAVSPVLGVVGGAAVAAGGWTFISRRFVNPSKKLLDKAIDEVKDEERKEREEERRKREEELNRLDAALKRDGDKRTDTFVEQLRNLAEAYRSNELWERTNVSDTLVQGVLDKVEDMFNTCIKALEQTLVLYDKIYETKNPRVKNVYNKRREDYISRVKESIDKLGEGLENLYQIIESSSYANGEDESVRKLASLGQEFSEQLEITRRVAKRMDSFDAKSIEELSQD
jgi:hypothetical protein